MRKVTISDEVFLALSQSGKTANEILQKVLPSPKATGLITREGVVFPDGTAFLVWYKERAYYGIVTEGMIEVMGEKFDNVSAAARKVTGSRVNGWAFWQCRRPTDKDFIKISTLRTAKTRKARVSK